MKGAQRILLALILVELLGSAAVVAHRWTSTRVEPPDVATNLDTLTGRELLKLPDQFLFDSPAKWRTLGEAYLVKGFFAKAEACLRRAHEADPASPHAAYPLGLCLERLGRVEEAEAVFRTAAGQARGELASICWNHVGRNLLRAERADDAARAFEAAGDDHFPSLFQRAKLLVRAGHADEAEPLLATLAEDYPEDLHVLYYRAQAAVQLNRTDEAQPLYDAFDRGAATLELDDTEDFHRRLREGIGMGREVERAVLLKQSGQRQAAADLLTRLAGEETRWENGYLFLLIDAAYAQVQAENFAAARPLLERQISDQQLTTGLLWELLGDVQNAQGQSNEAARSWERSARIQSNARLFFKLASAAESSRDAALSKRRLALAGLHGGIGLLRAGQPDESLQALRQALGLDPENPDLWYYAGEAERLLGRADAARAEYRRCLQLRPHHGRSLARLERLNATAD